MIDVSRVGPPSVHPTACLRELRVHPARSACQVCADACPRGAVGLTPLRVDPDLCDGCRLCVPACPTRALADAPTARVALEEALRAAEPGQPFTIACDEARDPDAASLRVRCLGALEWEAFALPSLLGASPVNLSSGDCATCDLRAGAQRARGRVAVARAVVVAAGGDQPMGSPQTAPTVAPRVSRRGLFRTWVRDGRGVARQAGAAIAEVAGLPVTSVERSWTRQAAHQLLAHRDLLDDPLPPVPRAGVPTIDPDACDGCRLCAEACPTDAITTSETTHTASLQVDTPACTACGACEDACRQNAVEISDLTHLTAWRDPPHTVQPRGRGRCTRCGAEALGAGLDLCAACYRAHGALGAPAEPGAGTAPPLASEAR